MLNPPLPSNGAHPPRSVAFASWLLCGLAALAAATGLSGCSLAPIANQTAAFAAATTTVTTSSKNAYRKANSLYFEEQSSAAIFKYDSIPNWDPRTIQPLLSDKQLQARYDLLDALRTYAREVDAVENAPKNLPGLDTAAQSVGNSLLSVSTNLSGDLTSTGVASSPTTLTQDQANHISTAAYALGEFLAARKVKASLPGKIEKLDPTITTICQVLGQDIVTIQKFTDTAYDQMLAEQDRFIRRSPTMGAVDRRREIARLPSIVQRKQISHDLLDDLKLALDRLALAHHALAGAAVGDNSISLAARIADLEAAGETLASFYSNLPPG